MFTLFVMPVAHNVSDFQMQYQHFIIVLIFFLETTFLILGPIVDIYQYDNES